MNDCQYCAAYDVLISIISQKWFSMKNKLLLSQTLVRMRDWLHNSIYQVLGSGIFDIWFSKKDGYTTET